MRKAVIITLYILTIMFSLSACKQKSKEQTLIENIEQFHIDTIVAKPLDKPVAEMTAAEKCRYKADMILRKYPELYNATDMVQKLYYKWIEREKDFIHIALINKDKESEQIFSRNEEKFNARMEELYFVEPLCAAIYEDNTAGYLTPMKMQMIPDKKILENCYYAVAFALPDGEKDSSKGYSTDERRTACGRAMKAWEEYINAFEVFLPAVPEQCRTDVETGLIKIRQKHIIDLKNIYLSLWTNNKPAWLLNDDATDEQIKEDNKEILNFIK